jgi:hypothetical protein
VINYWEDFHRYRNLGKKTQNVTLSTLIYAAPRTDIEEMIAIRKMLQGLMGKSFVENAERNEGNCVNKVVSFIDQLFNR